MTTLGIDPGKSGGLALIDDDGTLIDAVKMPATDGDLLDLLREWQEQYEPRAWLEFVRSSPQMGVTSAFTFGRGYGALRMALFAAGIPFTEVTPAKWQRGYKLPKSSVGTTAKKRVHKQRARELFPSAKVTHALADALLIADYGRRQP